MSEIIEFIFWHDWWSYSKTSPDLFSVVYHWFNIAEGVVWIVLAGLVFFRFAVHRKSSFEIAYSVAFIAFAITDFREAWTQSSWLIWLKLVNLILLLWLRQRVMSRNYPTAGIY